MFFKKIFGTPRILLVFCVTALVGAPLPPRAPLSSALNALLNERLAALTTQVEALDDVLKDLEVFNRAGIRQQLRSKENEYINYVYHRQRYGKEQDAEALKLEIDLLKSKVQQGETHYKHLTHTFRTLFLSVVRLQQGCALLSNWQEQALMRGQAEGMRDTELDVLQHDITTQRLNTLQTARERCELLLQTAKIREKNSSLLNSFYRDPAYDDGLEFSACTELTKGTEQLKASDIEGRIRQTSRAKSEAIKRKMRATEQLKPFYMPLSIAYEAHLGALLHLKATQDAFSFARKKLRAITNFHRFRIPDVEPVTLSFPLQCARECRQFFEYAREELRTLTYKHIRLSPILLLISFFIFWMSTKKRHVAFQSFAQLSIGKITKDNFVLTLSTILWNLWLALPAGLTAALLSFALNLDSAPAAMRLLSGILWETGPLFFLLRFIALSASERPSLFVEHFRFSAARTAEAMKQYRLTTIGLTLLLTLMLIFTSEEMQHYNATLGRLYFLALCKVLIFIAYRLKQVGIPLFMAQKPKQGDRLTHFAWWTIILVVLAAMAFAFQGHLAPAKELLLRFIGCIFTWTFCLLIYQLFFRWMFLHRRRLAFDRAKQRRAELLAHRARSEEGFGNLEYLPEIEEQRLDLETMSLQSLQLVRSLLLLGGGVVCFWILSSMIASFSFLDTQVWLPFSTPTLYSLIFAGGVLFIAAQMHRNLPALLDIIFLPYFEWSPSSAYTMKTITQYGVIAFGSFMLFSIIGVQWNEFQWCATAAVAGLTFGVREIFCSLVAGLIVLAQKQLRVGDMVTLGGTTGTVTKIGVLNTTLLDRDRKECLIPNKDIINDRMTNWSLSDSINRVVIKLSLPVDVSSERVITLLEQSVKETPQTLDSPASEIVLTEILNGRQYYEIRTYIADITQLTPIKRSLYQALLKRFAEHEIALSSLESGMA